MASTAVNGLNSISIGNGLMYFAQLKRFKINFMSCNLTYHVDKEGSITRMNRRCHID